MIRVKGGGELQWQRWLLATMVATRQVCSIVFPYAVVAGILLVGMKSNEGDGQRVMMTATMTARTGGC